MNKEGRGGWNEGRGEGEVKGRWKKGGVERKTAV